MTFVICTCYIVEGHTGENLKESLLEILKKWSLDQGKQVAITTHGGSNIKLAGRLLGFARWRCFNRRVTIQLG